MTDQTADESAMARVADLLHELQPGSMVHRFVLVAESLDGEDRWVSAFVAPGQKAWDTLGLLQYALTYEQQAFAYGEEDE